MHCRPHCGACCTAPSISSPIPGMPIIQGVSKPAGVPCIHLDAAKRCRIFDDPRRPKVCASLQPSLAMCGESAQHAMRFLSRLEKETAPT